MVWGFGYNLERYFRFAFGLLYAMEEILPANNIRIITNFSYLMW